MTKKKDNTEPSDKLTIQEKKEFLDIMDEHIGNKDPRFLRAAPIAKKNVIESPGLELLSFLDSEGLRLKQISELVCNKLPSKAEHPQSDRLIEKQLETNLAYREELIFKISEHSSDLNINLKSIWDLHFKSS